MLGDIYALNRYLYLRAEELPHLDKVSRVFSLELQQANQEPFTCLVHNVIEVDIKLRILTQKPAISNSN